MANYANDEGDGEEAFIIPLFDVVSERDSNWGIDCNNINMM
jgi:hypothetical protein